MTNVKSLETLAFWPQRMRHRQAFYMAALVDAGLATRSESEGDDPDHRALYTITDAGREHLRSLRTEDAEQLRHMVAERGETAPEDVAPVADALAHLGRALGIT